MPLQDELDAQKQEFEAAAPPEAVAVLHRATADLAASGIMEGIVKAGDRAPDFALDDARGTRVELSAELTAGPVVLGFYRGRW